MAAIFAPETDSDHAVGRKPQRQRQYRDSRPATCTGRFAGRGERRGLRLTHGDAREPHTMPKPAKPEHVSLTLSESDIMNICDRFSSIAAKMRTCRICSLCPI